MQTSALFEHVKPGVLALSIEMNAYDCLSYAWISNEEFRKAIGQLRIEVITPEQEQKDRSALREVIAREQNEGATCGVVAAHAVHPAAWRSRSRTKEDVPCGRDIGAEGGTQKKLAE